MHKTSKEKIYLVISASILALISIILFAISDNLLFLLLPFGIIIMGVSFYNPMIGILILLLLMLNPELFNTPEIEPIEVLWLIFFFLISIGGIVKALMRKKISLFYKNRSVIYPLLLFDFFVILSSIVAYTNSVPLIWYMRESRNFWGYFLPILILISVEEKDRKTWAKIFLSVFIFSGFVEGIRQMYFSLEHLSQVSITGTLASVRSFGYATFFGLPCSIFAIALYVEAKTLKQKLFYILYFLFFFFILIASFTRALWLGFTVSLITLYIFFKPLINHD